MSKIAQLGKKDLKSKDKNPINFDWLFYTLVTIFLVVAFFVTLYPFIYISAVSLSGYWAVQRGDVFLWPVDFTLEGYSVVLRQAGLLRAYYNTLWYTIVGTTLSVIATAIAAYPLSRKEFVIRRPLNFFIAFTMFFSGGMIPGYLNIVRLGLLNSRWVMIIPGLVGTFNIMIVRSAYSAVPDELTESAKIDGANDLMIFARVAVHLIKPTLAVIALFIAVGQWNNFFTPLLYISNRDLQPMSVLLRRVLLQGSAEMLQEFDGPDRDLVSLQIRYVTIMVATLPILASYPFIQRFFIKGVMLGAVKG